MFYTGSTGGSSWEIVRVTAIAPVSVACIQIMQLAIPRPDVALGNFLLNFALVTWPLYCSFVLPECAGHLILALIAGTVVAAAAGGLNIRATGAALRDFENALNLPRKSFLTAYRATMMLATCIAILAVDFQSFPRRMAKTETFGVSLMDAGVGSVLLTQAIVSPTSREPSATALRRVTAALLSTSPLVILGGVRLLSTLAADYHTHVSEYGVHWNFFFTLAVISLLGNALSLRGGCAVASAVLVACAYQYALSHTSPSLEDYILNSPRVDLVSANREGIFGCAGYAAVFFSGVGVGKVIFVEKRSALGWLVVCGALLLAAAVLWGGVVVMADNGYNVSRRLVNLPYVVWTMAYNLFMLALFLAAEVLVHWFEMPVRERERKGEGEREGGGFAVA
jgi:phosphatidylinositol glycan class W